MKHHWLLVMPAAALLVAFLWDFLPAGTVEVRFQSSGFRPDEVEIALCLGGTDKSGKSCISLLYVHDQDENGLNSQDGEGA